MVHQQEKTDTRINPRFLAGLLGTCHREPHGNSDNQILVFPIKRFLHNSITTNLAADNSTCVLSPRFGGQRIGMLSCILCKATIQVLAGAEFSMLSQGPCQFNVSKYHRLGGLNNKHLFLTILECREVQDQGIRRFSVW